MVRGWIGKRESFGYCIKRKEEKVSAGLGHTQGLLQEDDGKEEIVKEKEKK